MATADTSRSTRPRSDRELITEFALSAEVVPATRTKYQAHLAAFSAWLEADGSSPRLLDAAPADVQRFLGWLRDEHRPGGGLSPSTRRNYLASLRSFYRYCVSVRLAASDPSTGIRSPKLAHSPGMYLTADELKRLLSINTNPRDRIQTHLLAYTGARSNELLTLHWSDVDFAQQVLHLNGKGGKPRAIPMHPVLVAELRRWFVHQEIAAERSPAVAAARSNPATDFVLLTRTGAPVQRSSFYRQLKRRAVLAGLYPCEPKGKEYRSAVSPHAIRRSFATLLLNDGHPIDAVADVLGHRSIDTTRKHYAFSSNERRRATIEGLRL